MRDKDGVSALLLVCELAAAAKAEGRTLTDLLDDIAVEHGLHATDQLSVRFDDLSEIPADHGAAARPRRPPRSAGSPSSAVDDLVAWAATPCRPPTGCATRLADGARVIVRPSGTEPKVKCYLEVVVPVDPEDGVDAARIAAAGRLDAIGRHQGRGRALRSCQAAGAAKFCTQ